MVLEISQITAFFVIPSLIHEMIYIHGHMCIYVHRVCAYVYIYLSSNICIWMYTHTHICTYLDEYICICTQTRTHTYPIAANSENECSTPHLVDKHILYSWINNANP